MDFPAEVLADMEEAKQLYSDLNAEFIAEMKKGCDGCFPKSYVCLGNLLRDLEYKNELSDFDTVALSLYNKMMFILGGEPYVPPVTVNAIYTGTGVPTTEEEILLGLLTPYYEEGQMLAVFNNASVAIMFLAIPLDAPVPNYYESINNPFDQGAIGTVSDLFGAFSVVGSFRVTTTNFPLVLTDTYLLTTI